MEGVFEMGLFDFLKKKRIIKQIESTNDLGTMAKALAESGIISVPKDKYHNTFGQSLDHLDEDGELPFGWVYHNKEFTDKILFEFSHFLNSWIEVRGKDVSKEYAALKSLVLYIKDAKNLCDSKTECFSKWFSDCIADQKYLEVREADLKYIEEHFDESLEKEAGRNYS